MRVTVRARREALTSTGSPRSASQQLHGPVARRPPESRGTGPRCHRRTDGPQPHTQRQVGPSAEGMPDGARQRMLQMVPLRRQRERHGIVAAHEHCPMPARSLASLRVFTELQRECRRWPGTHVPAAPGARALCARSGPRPAVRPAGTRKGAHPGTEDHLRSLAASHSLPGKPAQPSAAGPCRGSIRASSRKNMDVRTWGLWTLPTARRRAACRSWCGARQWQ
jgi:hypothetical protein